MEKLLKYVDGIGEWTGKLASFLVIFLIGIVTYDIITRDIFAWGNVWVYNVSLYLFSGHFILGVAYAHQYRAHASVDVIMERLSARRRVIADIVTIILFLAPFCVMVLWWGGYAAKESWRYWERSIDTPWYPIVFPMKTLLPFGFLLLLVQGLVNLIRDVKLLRSK